MADHTDDAATDPWYRTTSPKQAIPDRMRRYMQTYRQQSDL
jgi:hypothetical protein